MKNMYLRSWAYYEKNNLNPESCMLVVPVAFSKYGVAMLTHVKRLIEDDDGLVAIRPRFESLLVALRTATSEGGRLLKDKSSNHDVLDAFGYHVNIIQGVNDRENESNTNKIYQKT
jgi:hypothetical protein